MAIVLQPASDINLPVYFPEQWLVMSKARKCSVYEVVGSRVVGPLLESPTACYCLADENNKLISTLFIQTGREMSVLPMLSVLEEYRITDAILLAYSQVVLDKYSGTALTYCCGSSFINPTVNLTSAELAHKVPAINANPATFRLKNSAWESAPKPGTMRMSELQKYSLPSLKSEELSAVMLLSSIVERVDCHIPTIQVANAIKMINENPVYFGSEKYVFRLGDTVMAVTTFKNVSSILGESRFALYATKEKSVYQFMLVTKSTLYVGILEGANKKWPLAVRTTHKGVDAVILSELWDDIMNKGCSRFIDNHSALDLSLLWKQHTALYDYFS